MKQKLEKLRHSKILIAVTIVVAAILYITCFAISFNRRSTDKQTIQAKEDEHTIIQPVEEVKEEELTAQQEEILSFLSNVNFDSNYTLYCEYQDHSYHLLSKSSDALQLQYDDKIYRIMDNQILVYNDNAWGPISSSDEELYSAYVELQKAIDIVSAYISKMQETNLKEASKVTIKGEPFICDMQYKHDALMVNLEGYYQDVYMIISNIGTTYF